MREKYIEVEKVKEERALRQSLGKKKKKNYRVKVSERDCGDRNRPAEADLSGSVDTSVVKQRGGDIGLSKY